MCSSIEINALPPVTHAALALNVRFVSARPALDRVLCQQNVWTILVNEGPDEIALGICKMLQRVHYQAGTANKPVIVRPSGRKRDSRRQTLRGAQFCGDYEVEVNSNGDGTLVKGIGGTDLRS